MRFMGGRSAQPRRFSFACRILHPAVAHDAMAGSRYILRAPASIIRLAQHGWLHCCLHFFLFPAMNDVCFVAKGSALYLFTVEIIVFGSPSLRHNVLSFFYFALPWLKRQCRLKVNFNRLKEIRGIAQVVRKAFFISKTLPCI